MPYGVLFTSILDDEETYDEPFEIQQCFCKKTKDDDIAICPPIYYTRGMCDNGVWCCENCYDECDKHFPRASYVFF